MQKTSAAMSVRSVLIVDDEQPLREKLLDEFVRRGCAARGAATVAEAVALARAEPVDLAVVDLQLGSESGLDVVERIAGERLARRVVVLSGYASVAVTVAAMRLGAADVVNKPAGIDRLLDEAGPLPDKLEVPSLHRNEWEHIQRVLRDCAGSVSETARKLGIPRRTLQRKLRKAPPKV